jgi:hypothetical protein
MILFEPRICGIYDFFAHKVFPPSKNSIKNFLHQFAVRSLAEVQRQQQKQQQFL